MPPQVQVTTTYTGADAQTRRRHGHHADRAADQRHQGADLLQLRQHQQRPVEHRRHVRRRLLAGHRRRRHPEQGRRRPRRSLPPEVKQYGVTIKKTSTDMVCVVNLISPDGRYDATFLDNYGQINVADVLKRIPGVSDVNVLRPQVRHADLARPGPHGQPADRARPRSIQAIQQENKQAAAGKIGGLPVPAGPAVRVPDHVQGAAVEGRASSRRSSSAATTTARSSASRTSPASSSTRRTTRRPAGSTASPPARIPIYQSPTPTPWTSSSRSARRWTGSRRNFPRGPRIPDRLRHDPLRRREHHRGRAHADRGVRPGA